MDSERQQLPEQEPMLSPSRGALRSVFARYAMGGLAILTVALGAYALYTLRYVALLFVIAALLSFGLGFPVNWLSRKMHRILAVIIVSITSLALLAGIVAILLPTAIKQGRNFYDAIPILTTQAMDALRGWQITLIPGEQLQVFDYIETFWTEYQATWAERAPEMLSGVFDYGQLLLDGTVAAVAALIVIPILTLYFLLDGPRIRRAFLLLLPDKSQETASQMLTAVNRSVGGYILSRLGMALYVGITYTLLLLIAGYREYALLIGLVGFLGELIPIVGPILAYVPIALLIIATTPEGWFVTLLWVTLVVGVIQVTENYLVGPKLMGDSMDLHPLTVIAALLVGGTVGKVIGLIIAVPIAAVIKMVIVYYVNRRRGLQLKFGEGLKEQPDKVELPSPS